MAKNMRVQAARFLSKYVALNTPRHPYKHSDQKQFTTGIHSVRTLSENIGALAKAGESLGVQRLKHIDESLAVHYLIHRYQSGMGKKTIARDRVALQRLISKRLPSWNELHKLDQATRASDQWVKEALRANSKNKTLTRQIREIWKGLLRTPTLQEKLTNERKRVTTRNPNSPALKDKARAYQDRHIVAIANTFKDEQTKLAILIARDAGLRAHELLTIRKLDEGAEVSRQRDWSNDRHAYRRNTVEYKVTGKGGLVRTVRLNEQLAERLEKLRYDTPVIRRDRGVIYESRYDISAGNSLSQKFTNASVKLLGYSTGLHGLRHSYAQKRLQLLIKYFPPRIAKTIVSQELGHMRSSITDVYLR